MADARRIAQPSRVIDRLCDGYDLLHNAMAELAELSAVDASQFSRNQARVSRLVHSCLADLARL